MSAAVNTEKSISSATSGASLVASAGCSGTWSEISVACKSGAVSSSSSVSVGGTIIAMAGSGVGSSATSAAAEARTGSSAAVPPQATAKGTSVPSRRMASADRRKDSGSQPVARPAAMSSAQLLKACRASVDNCSKLGCMGFCSASQTLSTCSIDQAASPKSFSPTMRELPLSVWNARRRVVCSLRSPGSPRSCSMAARPFTTTSRASSRNTSSSSSSTSGTAAGAAATTGATASAGAGAATAGAGTSKEMSGARSAGPAALPASAAGVDSKSGNRAKSVGSLAGSCSGNRGITSGTTVAERSSSLAGASSTASEARARVLPMRMRSSPSSSSYTKSLRAMVRW